MRSESALESAAAVITHVAIRPYRPEDEPWLFNLARDAFGDKVEWQDQRTLRTLETDVVFIAEVSGSTAGYAALERLTDAVRIEQLLVVPEHKDAGVEGRLVEYVEGYAIFVGARSLQAVVEDDNLTALAFYRGRGFASVATSLVELVLPQR
jgi:ribosomal protein S18 acetylase RimI-like enzyme